jgi:hypothetical protein
MGLRSRDSARERGSETQLTSVFGFRPFGRRDLPMRTSFD